MIMGTVASDVVLVPWQAVLLIFVLGALFAGSAGRLLLRERALERRGSRAYASVVAQDEHYGVSGDGVSVSNRSTDPGQPTRRPWSVSTGDKGLVQTPIVEFTTDDGTVVRTRSRISSNAGTAVPGKTVVVHYDPADPHEVAIAGYGRGLLRLFVAIGVFLIAVGVVLLVVPGDTLESVAPIAVPLILGSVFLGLGVFAVGRVLTLRIRGVVARGTVVGETTSSTREGVRLHHPKVRFRLPTGHDVETVSERGRVIRRVRVGDQVDVRYHPDDPYRMLLVGDGPRPLFVIFGLVGVLILTGTTVIIAVALR